MNTEKIINPPSGYLTFALFLLLLALTGFFIYEHNAVPAIVIFIVDYVLILPGL
jgi:hypothetical protein